MFRNNTGCFRADAEAFAEQIKRVPEREIEALEERQGILRDALNSFNARLAELPQRERQAALSLLYKEVADKVFDFHLSILTNRARDRIAVASTRESKQAALREFQAMTEDLAMLHGIPR